MLNELLQTYITDTTNPEIMAQIADAYFDLDQLAAAACFYHRAAEYAADSLMQKDSALRMYCLIKCYHCYDIQGGRDITAKSMLSNAMMNDPFHPAPYFYMSRHFEKEGNWFDAYQYAVMGWSIVTEVKEEKAVLDYKGEWNLLFQMALTAWWCSMFEQSKEDFQFLYYHHFDQMDQQHQDLLMYNMRMVGVESDESHEDFIKRVHNFNVFTNNEHDRLVNKFPGSENIETNFSQIYQDIFVLTALNGKKNGTYLEIGAGDPFLGSNTALLEQDYGWTGVAIEKDTKLAQAQLEKRQSDVVNIDALWVDYDSLLKEKFGGRTTVDYLQIDIDPAHQSLEALKKIPFDRYVFNVITFEHDFYVDGSDVRDQSRTILEEAGYNLVVANVSSDGKDSFEDFWVHESLATPHLKRAYHTKAEDYFLDK